MKFLKKFFNNKPWKDVKTRKISFMYCLIFGTIAIIFGGIMICFGKFDSSTWFSESLDFFKWVITTGTVVVLLSNVQDVIKFTKGYTLEEDDTDDGDNDDTTE